MTWGSIRSGQLSVWGSIHCSNSFILRCFGILGSIHYSVTRFYLISPVFTSLQSLFRGPNYSIRRAHTCCNADTGPFSGHFVKYLASGGWGEAPDPNCIVFLTVAFKKATPKQTYGQQVGLVFFFSASRKEAKGQAFGLLCSYDPSDLRCFAPCSFVRFVPHLTLASSLHSSAAQSLLRRLCAWGCVVYCGQIEDLLVQNKFWTGLLYVQDLRSWANLRFAAQNPSHSSSLLRRSSECSWFCALSCWL